MIEPIYFSLYAKVPDYNVRIFQSTDWILENGVSLEVSIIGKSHRVISRLGEECLTEFITCFDRKLPDHALDRVCLQPGVIHDREYRSGNLVYRVHVEQVSRLYTTMDEFIKSLGGIVPVNVLTHEFAGVPSPSGTPPPFTGLALNANTFYTVHTYPESGTSIVSRTTIGLPVLSMTT
jgi:S-adenosylmethionine/arginine decarboxylase-like enzyme